MNKKEIIYLDIIKVFACFMVIINHTNSVILENKTFVNAMFYCLVFAICKVGVGLFLMVTGALALKKQYDYKKVLKCILRVLVPVFILSFNFYIRDVGISNINIIDFFKLILKSPYTIPYWYVYALIGIYLALPFMQKMVKNFRNQDYIMFIIMFLIGPTFINLLKSYVSIDINSNFELAFFPIIMAFVISGNYISKIKLSKKGFIISILSFLVAYIGMFYSMYVPYLINKEIVYTLDSWSAFPVVLMCISLFYIFRYLFENRNYSEKMRNIIIKVTSTTFGIYLIHSIVNYRLYRLGIVQLLFRFNAIVGVIILDLLVFVVCMIIVYILKKVTYVKKFL